MSHIIYDTGALIAAAKNNQAFLYVHYRALGAGRTPVVPAGVLAQGWDSRPRAAALHRVLHGCQVLPFTEAQAKAAAALCQENKTSDVIDATVVLASLAYDDAPILTDDLGDIRALAACAGRARIHVERP
ncbi:twitching motility protein PilT [Streptomyces coelicoflavus]|uniref:twitching motility protein PilT n=1 Tax=Streptomyces coelicoflavus TaxID=285562 RepID=UPI002E271329